MTAKFSIIGLQEVWSVSRQFMLPGHHPLEFKTRDQNSTPNPNCGGGVGMFVSDHINYKIVHPPNIFIKGVFESLWIKIKLNNVERVIGTIYRPNTPPLSSPELFNKHLAENI